MKQVVRIFLYLVIVLLVLEVVKTVLVKADVPYSYSIGIAIACLQMLMVLGVILIPLFFRFLKKRTQHVRKAMGLSFLTFFIIIACCEGLTLLLMHNPDKLPGFLLNTFDFYYNSYDRSIIQFKNEASVYDPQLFYTLKPNARFRYVNVEFNNAFSTNKLGLRDDDSSLNRPAIIGLGDSFGMGWGVEQDSTYSQRLEVLTHQKVLNTGISSYGTAREIMSIRRFDTSALSLLVIQYSDNDVEENTDYIKNNHVLKVSSKETYDKTVQTEIVKNFYYPGKHFLITSQVFIKQQINKVAPVFRFPAAYAGPALNSGGQAKLFLDVLSDAPVDFAHCKVIVFYPDKNTDKSRAFETAVDALVHETPYKERFGNRLQVLKVSAFLNAGDFYILDDHMKGSGHRKIAEGIWKTMQAF